MNSWSEITAAVLGLANVWLLARQSIWNWPLGIATTALYFVVFLRSGLYGDAGLQIVFVLLNAFGWWYWIQRPLQEQPELLVVRIAFPTWCWLLPGTVVGAIVLTLFLGRFTDSKVPQWDGLTTSLSLAATYGQTKKLLESWWFWIAADLIYIPLYFYKDLWPTSLLYVVFLALCVAGLRNWRRALTRML